MMPVALPTPAGVSRLDAECQDQNDEQHPAHDIPLTLGSGILIRPGRHCEERSDEAIQIEGSAPDCFACGSQ
jgi:hypothetical protein